MPEKSHIGFLTRSQTPQYWAIACQYIVEDIGNFLEDIIYKTDTNINDIFNQPYICKRNWTHILKYFQKEISTPRWALVATFSK